jgi:tetratricopeptide (TPR) repeat protein
MPNPPDALPIPRPWLAPALMLAMCALAALAYLPGLNGGFLFDDFVNLDALGATGPVDDLPTLWRYLSSGTADPLGRPLALLSFLLDGRDWPTEPFPFLRTNLVLHLGIGLLLWRLLATLGETLEGEASQRTRLSAALAAGLWLLHPLLVSTTLYVVQREAMLPSAFVLLGLLGFLAGRRRYQQGDRRSGAVVGAGSIVVCTGLAMLCKANGVLLPLLALVVDSCLPFEGDVVARTSWRRFCMALLVAPSLLVLAYLLSFLANANLVLPHRGWTIGDRLLTEGRVLCSYLQLLVVPRSVSTGLYNDAYVVSRGLLSPWTTLPCLLVALGLPTCALFLRKRFPALSMAVLFFFAAQVLESTTVPLELYFEHRNYLPSMLLAWPLACALTNGRLRPAYASAVALALVLLLAGTTLQRATLWGQPARMAALWARQNPDSSRAQATMALTEISEGRPQAALARLQPLRRARPTDLQLAFNEVHAACMAGGLQPGQAATVERALSDASEGLQLAPGWLERMLQGASARQCAGLDLEVASRWLTAFERNPEVSGQKAYVQDVEPLNAQLALARGDAGAALDHFNAAFLAFPTADVAARQAAMLARAGDYRQALAHLDLYESRKRQLQPPGWGMPRVHRWVLQRENYWPREMALLRAKLLAASQSSTATREAPR